MAHAPSAPPIPEGMDGAHQSDNHDAPAMPQKDAGADCAVRKVLSTETTALIKAWEESEKTKVENKANKKLSNVGIWERSKQASIEARQRKYEEKLEKKKALYVEKMQNKIAELHKDAEEKRMMVEAAKREERQKVEETAEKYRATGYTPKKILPCFNS